ncbi:MAG: NAD(P)-dependent oxidoreductase [Myxococcota bacterium]
MVKICVTGDRVASLREAALRMAPELEVLTLGGTAPSTAIRRDWRSSTSPRRHEVPAATQRVLELFHAPGLRWVQSPGAGVDHPIWQTLLDRGVQLTNASGIHAEPIAQYIFTYVLFWEREVARHLEQQRRRHWEIVSCGDLVGRTLGIVGYGGIGRATARVAKAFGMRVVGCRRTRVDDPLLDRQVGPDGLHALLASPTRRAACPTATRPAA